MAHETGTAANPIELMQKLETFLTTHPTLVQNNQVWESVKTNQTFTYGADDTPDMDRWHTRRIFIGKGINRNDKIVVPMILRSGANGSYYTMNAFMARDYLDSYGIFNQPSDNQAGEKCVSISLWGNEMKYWFIANSRRFIVIVKIAHRYVSMYCGLFMPFGTDTEYLYPYCLGGNHSISNVSYTSSNLNSVRSFFCPIFSTSSSYFYKEYHQMSSLCAYTPAGDMIFFGGRISNSEKQTSGVTLPYFLPQDLKVFGKTVDNQYLLTPIELIQIHDVHNHLGWFDGVFHVSGVNNSPENVITVGSDNYICFPAMIQNDINQWAAFKLE